MHLARLQVEQQGESPEMLELISEAFATLGERMPDFELHELGGGPVRLADLDGLRAVLTFERSVDW